MELFSVQSSVWLPKSLSEVFSFFADARNLEQLTPARFRFRVLSSGPVIMGEGTKIDYRLRIYGIPVRWQSEITKWEPPYRFVDHQRRGPYQLWVHEHRFEGRGGLTRVDDFVRYAVFGGHVVDRFLVQRDLPRLFRFRRGRLRQIFGDVPTSELRELTSSEGAVPPGPTRIGRPKDLSATLAGLGR